METHDDVTSDETSHDLNLLAAFAEDRLTRDEEARLVEHLSVCADCREGLAMMSRTMSGPLARHASRLRLPRNSTWLAMAAVAVLAVGVIVRLNTTRGLSVPAHGEATGPPPAPSPPPQPAQPRPETGAPRKGTIQSTPAIDDRANLLTRRGGERTVGDKTFRLVAGEWIDTAYDSLAGLDVVSVTTADERVQLLRRMPVLVPYSALGNRVTVVVANVVYRFDTTAP